MSKKTSFLIIFSIIVLISFLNPLNIHAWSGIVIDTQTGQPIENVMIVRSWDRETAGPAGTVSSFLGMKETLTDEHGKFTIFGKIYFPGIPLLTWVVENRPIVFKPGYKFFVLDKKESIIKLEKIPTLINVRKEEVEKARGNYEVDFYETKTFKDIILREEEFIESSEPPIKTITHPSIPPKDIVLAHGVAIFGTFGEYGGYGESAKSDVRRMGKSSVESENNTVESMIKTLADQNTEAIARIHAASLLGESKDPKAVLPLIDALRDKNSVVIQRAAIGLGDIKDPRAIDPLINTLSNKDVYFVETIGQALMKIGEPAVESLISALKSKDKNIQRGAARILGRMGNPRAIEPLIELLNSRDNGVSWVAAVALSNYKEQRAIMALVDALKYRNDFGSWLFISIMNVGSPSVEPLIAKLRDGDSGVRSDAANLLGAIKDLRAVEHLIIALKDKEPEVQKSVAFALGNIKDPKAIDPLISTWNDEADEVRKQSAKAIISIGKPATEQLIKTLRNQNPYFRWRAAWCLGRIKDPMAAEPLVDVLNDEVTEVRWTAIYALGEIEDERAIKKLVELCDDQDIGIKEVAESSLTKIGRNTCREAFKSVDFDKLVKELKSDDPKVRRKTADYLGDVGKKEATKQLITLLADSDKYVRQAAARALGKLKDEKGVEPLIKSLKDDDEYVRAFSIWALGEIRDPRSVKHVVISLMDKEEKVINQSYEALRKLKADPDAKNMLEKIFIKAFESNNYSQIQKISYVLDEYDILKAFEDPEGESAKTIINYLNLLESNISKLKGIGVKGLKEYKDRGLVIEELSAIIKSDEKGYDDAILFLKGLNDPRCLALFTYILKNKERFTYTAKVSAVDAISDLGYEETTELLLEILSNTGEYEGLRDHAARALGKLGDVKAVAPLIKIINNPKEHNEVRVGAGVALGALRDKRAVEPLIDILTEKKEHVWLRVAAASALGDIGDERVIVPIKDTLKDPSDYVRNAAQNALLKIVKRGNNKK